MSNSATPPIPSIIAATPNLPQTQACGSATTTLSASAPPSTTGPREVRECLITIDLTCYWPNVFLSGYREQEGVLHWTGSLWDKSVLNDPWGAVPIGQRFIEDPHPDNGDDIVQNLQRLAMDRGYTHAQVRNYSWGDSDSYLDAGAFDLSFCGQLPAPASE